MYSVDRLNMSDFLQLFCQRPSQPVVVSGNKGFALLADQFEKSFIISDAQNSDFIQFCLMQLRVILKESKNFNAILPEDFKGHTAKVIGAEDNDWVFHWR